VLGVVNKVIVKPMFRLDVEIRDDLKHRIENSSCVKSGVIDVRVEDGVVFLGGSVGCGGERDYCTRIAGEIRGVKSVLNQLTVNSAIRMPDDEVRRNILDKLSHNVYLLGVPVAVTVKNGVVSLYGEVESCLQKECASDDAAAVSGVVGVQNFLATRLIKADEVRTSRPAVSDSELLCALSRELELDPRIDNAGAVRIGMRQGIITLTGTVPTCREKMAAERNVLRIATTAWICNLLQVRGVWRDDAKIYTGVNQALKSDNRILMPDRIISFVNEGVVTLKGNVASEVERSCVEQDVAEIIGVKDIRNYILVDWLPKYSDEALMGRIADRIAANGETWLVASRIFINVKNSRVLLTGSIDTPAQFKEAERIVSQTDGVLTVDNRLSVRGSENRIAGLTYEQQ
jgi:osmotically-inducible protein OsmY